MEKQINYFWIQKYDYSAKNYKINSIDDAISAYKKINWKNELLNFNENDDNFNCPPGIGFHDGLEDGSEFSKLIHICPIDENYVFYNMHYPVEKKLFGIIKYKTIKIYYNEKYPNNKIEEILRLFFNSNYKQIIELK